MGARYGAGRSVSNVERHFRFQAQRDDARALLSGFNSLGRPNLDEGLAPFGALSARNVANFGMMRWNPISQDMQRVS
jgi:hypothetical protein